MKNEMFCSVCHDHTTGKQRWQLVYIIGCTTFELEGIKSHERSTLHGHCIRIMQAKTDPSQTDGAWLLKLTTKPQTQKMLLLFQTVHALAKKARPCLDFFLVLRRQAPCTSRLYRVIRGRMEPTGTERNCSAVLSELWWYTKNENAINFCSL